MANKLILSTVLFLLTSVPVFSEDDTEIKPLDKKLHLKCLYPTVRVDGKLFVNNKLIPNAEVHGTGVVLSSKKIGDIYWNTAITASHVVNDNPFNLGNCKVEMKFTISLAVYKDWSTFVKYETYPIHVYKVDDKFDLAILVFRTPRKLHTADIDCESKLYIGTEVMRIGCGLGDQPRLDYGIITSLNPTFHSVKDKGRARLSLHTVPGDSGGGVFYNYKLKGIISCIRMMGQFPIFTICYMSKINNLPVWNKFQNNRLDFVYKGTKLPSIARCRMWFREQDVNKDFIHSKKYAIPKRKFQ